MKESKDLNSEIEDGDQKRDWRISAILLVIWIVGMAYIITQDTDIPRSMLIIASVFFVFLIPAMNDLVRSIERRFGPTNRADRNTR